MKRVFLVLLTLATAGLLGHSIWAQQRYRQLVAAAIETQENSGWFSVEVLGVDAETGEPVENTMIPDDFEYPEDRFGPVTMPRIRQEWATADRPVRLSGLAATPFTMFMDAPGYQASPFTISPDPDQPLETRLTVKLHKR